MSSVLSTQQNFSSVSQFSDAISQLGWSTKFQQLDCGTGSASFSAVMSSTAILQRVVCERRTQQNVVPPQNYQTFGLPLSPLSSSMIENRPLSNKEFIYVDELDGFSSVGDPGFEAFTVSLASASMAGLSQNLGLPDPGEDAALWGSEITPEPERLAAVKALVRNIFTLEQLASSGHYSNAETVLEQMISLELPSAIMQLAIAPRAEKRIPVRNRERALMRALDYIENHPKEALTVEALCAAAATSLSTLERGFRERFSISPKRYLTVQRLNQVQSALVNNSDGRSITDIAGEWGFWHTSQFAADYKALFGYRPSETHIS
ncbi:MAG: AraC family transcriptional regulator [Halieaceae bacterium]